MSETTIALTEQEASELIAERISQIEALTQECVKIANKYGVDFSFNPSGAYGMGGWYTAPKKSGEVEEDEDEDDSWYESGWQSSSSSC